MALITLITSFIYQQCCVSCIWIDEYIPIPFSYTILSWQLEGWWSVHFYNLNRAVNIDINTTIILSGLLYSSIKPLYRQSTYILPAIAY